MGEEKKFFLKLTSGEIYDLVDALIEAEVAAKERSTRLTEWSANYTDSSWADSCQKEAARCREKAQAYRELHSLIWAQRLSE